MTDLETNPPFPSKSRRLHRLAESTSSPIGTFIFRSLVAAGLAVLSLGVGVFNLGLKARAEQALVDSPAFKAATMKADEASKRAWEATQAIAAAKVESREKDTELSTNLGYIASSLKQVADQQLEITRQQSLNTTAIAVLTSHAADVDKTILRQDNAIDSMRSLKH